jgi:hypothetical protein
MISSFDNRLGLADVFGSLLLWVKFLSPEDREGERESQIVMRSFSVLSISATNLRVFFCVTSEARKDGYGEFLS